MPALHLGGEHQEFPVAQHRKEGLGCVGHKVLGHDCPLLQYRLVVSVFFYAINEMGTAGDDGLVVAGNFVQQL